MYYLKFGFEFPVIIYGIVDFLNAKLGDKRLISWQEQKLQETEVGCDNVERKLVCLNLVLIVTDNSLCPVLRFFGASLTLQS